jgi:hypothetical protein
MTSYLRRQKRNVTVTGPLGEQHRATEQLSHRPGR